MAAVEPSTVYETAMAEPNALENDLRSFYLTGSEEMSIFEEWEHGIARGDSTTPSICSPTYRWWILEHLRNALGRDRKNLLLSLGSGNAFVERVLGREGYPVLAVDALDEAVQLAREAGVPAICQNLYTWDARQEYWDVVYADGPGGSGWLTSTDACGYSTTYGCSDDGTGDVCGGCNWSAAFIACVVES